MAVRNGVDLGEAQPQELDQHQAEEGRKDVPGHKLVLALLRLLRRTASRRAFARPGARCLAISKQFQESPTRRGFFRMLRRLIEHVSLRWRHVSYRHSNSLIGILGAKARQHTEPLLPNLRCENIVSVL